MMHGMSRTPTYVTWQNMIARCYGNDEKRTRLYKNKGIKVCSKWLNFEGFFEDMGVKREKLQLDRIDGNGDYCKDNCRWVTHGHNQSNKIRTRRKSVFPRGVYKKFNKYRASIRFNGKEKHLGYFDNIIDASNAYSLAYKKIWGELPPEYRTEFEPKGGK
jgi:hypothetical protein